MATRPLSSTVCSKCPRNIPSTVERRHPSYCPTCHTTSSIQPHFAPPPRACNEHAPSCQECRSRPRKQRPPEEVCKPDSVLPPRSREQQPFVWPPGYPGDRATDPRERTGHPRQAKRPGLPPTRSCSGWGLPSARPHGRAWRALTSPFHPCSGPVVRGGLLSVALSPDRSGPSLAATLPCGVRTFLPPRRGGRLLDLLRRTRSLHLLLFALGPPEEDALAARAEDHMLVTLDLVEELGRDAHPAALTDTPADLHDRHPTPAREDQLVLAAEVGGDRLYQLAAPGSLALDLGRQMGEFLSLVGRLPDERGRQARQLGLQPGQPSAGRLPLLHDRHELGLDRTRLLLQQVDLPLCGSVTHV